MSSYLALTYASKILYYLCSFCLTTFTFQVPNYPFILKSIFSLICEGKNRDPSDLKSFILFCVFLLISFNVHGCRSPCWQIVVVPASLQSACYFSKMGLAEMMINKFTFREYSLASLSATFSVHCVLN